LGQRHHRRGARVVMQRDSDRGHKSRAGRGGRADRRSVPVAAGQVVAPPRRDGGGRSGADTVGRRRSQCVLASQVERKRISSR
jgi:hypothetical protein